MPPIPGRPFDSDFGNPPPTWRSVAFYSLNDQLDAGELCRQLEEFAAAGLGGIFFHSRLGLLTEYLSDEWFDLIATGVEKARSLGLQAWFYDEDSWPSGFAGGIVPRQNPEFQARCLLRTEATQEIHGADTLLAEDVDSRYVCHVFPLGSPRFNGAAWVDLLNPEMVQAFLECTYLPYARRFAGQPQVLGIFTDEPQLLPRPCIPHLQAIPYSPHLLSAFRDRNGYDLLENLTSLFKESGDWQRIRLDYYRTLAACFENAFAKPIAKFCAQNQLCLTGHYFGEESPTSNRVASGNLMQQLRHLHVPGIDSLGLNLPGYYNTKVMTSVANQYGRERRLSELFGIAGNNLSFEDRIWITAWHSLLGVNFLCPHLSNYSLKGARKRDFPPTLSFHQPWWKYQTLFEDVAARFCLFAGSGQTVAEIAVINPLESTYLEPLGTRSQIDPAIEQLLARVSRHHHNVDLVDEQILAEIGSTSGDTLVVGEMAYPVVVLPDMTSIRSSTITLLETFAKNGGILLQAGAFPRFLDGTPDASPLEAFRQVTINPHDPTELTARIPARFKLTGENSSLIGSHLRRENDGGFLLQLTNSSRRETVHGNFHWLDDTGPIRILNPIDGSRKILARDNKNCCQLDFAPAQSWILQLEHADDEALEPFVRARTTKAPVKFLSNEWTGTRLSPNALPLDFARTSLDGGNTWSEPEPVLAWYERFARSRQAHRGLKLRFEVTIDQLPDSCALAVEQCAMYQSICVNDQPVDFTAAIGFLDPCISTSDITRRLHCGTNQIDLQLDFTPAIRDSPDSSTRYGSEIETIYLVGDFAVQGRTSLEPLLESDRNRAGLFPAKPVHRFHGFEITHERKNLPGDLVPAGYPFFAGSFELSQSFDWQPSEPPTRTHLVFPSLETIVLEVIVNDVPFHPVFTAPWEVDISDAVQPGSNRLKLVLTNSLRNLLGPHHHAGGEPIAVGPASFSGDDTWPNNARTGDADWFDIRKNGQAKIWRDAYHLVPFGLLQPPGIQESPMNSHR